MLQVNVGVTLVFCFVFDLVQPELVLIHLIFRHGEKTPDSPLMPTSDSHKNDSFYPYGPSRLTNEGKRTIYSLGEDIRERYDKFIGDIYTPDILDAWSSSYERCQSSLQVLLASLFPPKGALIWRESLMWQPITYKSLLKEEDNLFISVLMSDYEKIYNRYYLEGNRKALMNEIKPLLSYVQKHYNATMRTFRDLFILHTVLSGEHGYGLELPEWSKKIYPQPLNDMLLKEYSMQMGTKELSRRAIGRLIKKILEDIENRIKNRSTYKLHLYSGHDLTIAHILIFLKIINKSLVDWGACLALELHKETETYFLEVHYKKDKHSKFDLLQFSNGKRRIYLHDFKDMVEKLYTDDAENTNSNGSSISHGRTQVGCLLLLITLLYFLT